MNANDSRRGREVTDLARILPVPADRDLPAGRRRILKEHLMAEFRADHAAALPAARVRRARRTALAVAAGACVLAVAVASASLTALARHAGPHAGPGQGGVVTAAQLLSKIANAASRSHTPNVRASQYEYIASEVAFSQTSVTIGQPGSKTVLAKPHKRQIWLSVSDLCRPGLLREYGQNTRLADQGSSCPDQGSLNDPTYRLLQSLPTGPRTLLNLIYTTEKGHGQTRDHEAFTTIGDLLGESITPPKVSAALYRAAALIPGVSVVPRAVDAIGRPGVAVAFTYRGSRSEWIFDKKTLQWLGEREASAPTGKVTGESAVLARGFVNRPGQVPPVG